MNADAIAKAYEKIGNEADGNRLHNACHERIAEIEQRRRQITAGHPIYGNPPEHDRAILKGDAAIAALDAELAALDREQDRLGPLAALCIEAGFKAERQRVAREIPKAVARLPDLNRAISKARDALLQVMTQHREAITTIGQFGECGIERPLTDGDLVDLIRLRDSLWALPDLTVIEPNQSDRLAFNLYTIRRGDARSPTVSVRRRFDDGGEIAGRDPVIPLVRTA